MQPTSNLTSRRHLRQHRWLLEYIRYDIPRTASIHSTQVCEMKTVGPNSLTHRVIFLLSHTVLVKPAQARLTIGV